MTEVIPFCTECRQPLIIFRFEVKGTHNIVLVTFCPNCDVWRELDLDLWEMVEEHPPHGRYL